MRRRSRLLAVSKRFNAVAVGLLGTVLGLVCLLLAFTEPADEPAPASSSDPDGATVAKDGSPVPGSVLAVACVWTALLVASLVCFERIDAFADFVSFKLGRLPFESIWFGAVGGLLISAQGVFEYNRRWDRSFDYWHYVRPLLGAIIGTLGCLVFIVLNDAATAKHVAANAVFYDVIALGIGYREASFRELIARLIDTIILPGEKKNAKNADTDKSKQKNGVTEVAGGGQSKPSSG